MPCRTVITKVGARKTLISPNSTSSPSRLTLPAPGWSEQPGKRRKRTRNLPPSDRARQPRRRRDQREGDRAHQPRRGAGANGARRAARPAAAPALRCALAVPLLAGEQRDHDRRLRGRGRPNARARRPRHDEAFLALLGLAERASVKR
jgi:hypothetical protein